VAHHVLWNLAHKQGMKLPFRNYWEFRDALTAHPDKVKSLDDYLAILHEWTEKIQSSPMAIECSVQEIIAKEYRASNVTAIELRFNPMKRNVKGEKDLDHIIHAALRGMDQACLEYGSKACLIFCLAREFSFEQNEIIVDKAIKYISRGVTAIDLAGSEKKSLELDPSLAKEYAVLFARARDAGLKTTVHTGETKETGGEGIVATLKYLKPHRIGHGIWAARYPKAMDALLKSDVHLELNPSSNVSTHAVKNWDEFGEIVQTFLEKGIRFSINTDGPYILNTHLRREFDLLIEHKILTQSQTQQCLKWAREDSFIPDLS
jgi:adenosine deaminase